MTTVTSSKAGSVTLLGVVPAVKVSTPCVKDAAVPSVTEIVTFPLTCVTLIAVGIFALKLSTPRLKEGAVPAVTEPAVLTLLTVPVLLVTL